MSSGLVADPVPHVDLLERHVPVSRGHLAVDEGADVRARLELGDEVARHALRDRRSTTQDGDASGVVREEERGLARRVARAHDVDVLAVRGRRLAAGRAVGDPLPGEAVGAVDRELPPGDAAREDDRACSDDVAAVEMDLARRGVDALDRARDEDLRAEPACLLQRSAGQLVARHAGGEAEVVLDPRRGPGLTARGLPFHHHGVEPLGGAVDRCSQTGGSGADDHRVVLRRLRLCPQLEELRHTTQLGADHRLAADHADRRKVGLLWERAVPVVGRHSDRPA